MHGRVDNLDDFKKVILLENGISSEMYPYQANKQAEEINQNFD